MRSRAPSSSSSLSDDPPLFCFGFGFDFGFGPLLADNDDDDSPLAPPCSACGLPAVAPGFTSSAGGHKSQGKCPMCVTLYCVNPKP